MPYYVTTPIYYVNGEPHLGHVYTTVAADVLARHMRQRGEDVFFLTGTDEHGEPVAQAAEREGVTPRELADRNAERFREVARRVDATNDFFIRTSDEEHEAAVAEIVTRLKDNGHVYEGTYEGWYCPRCADFKTDSELIDGNKCPIHLIVLEREKEDNWFFKLSAFQERLEQLYADRPDSAAATEPLQRGALLHQERAQRLLALPRADQLGGADPMGPRPGGLRLGRRAPQLLLGAVVRADRARTSPTDSGRRPSTLIAKDILKFHARVLAGPADGCRASRCRARVFVHGYLLMDDHKMSKSLGNVLDPFAVMDVYGTDALRYYLMREVAFGQDGSISTEGFETRYNTELANEYGNLASRTLAMIGRYRDGVVPEAEPEPAIAESSPGSSRAVRDRLDRVEVTGALEEIWERVRALNRYVQDEEPWKVAKDESRAADLDRILYTAAEGLRVVSVLMHPYVPDRRRSAARRARPGGRRPRVRARSARAPGERKIGELGQLFPKVEVAQCLAPSGLGPRHGRHPLPPRLAARRRTRSSSRNARAVGVSRLATVGMNDESIERALAAAREHDGRLRDRRPPPALQRGLGRRATSRRSSARPPTRTVVAIGETGLDYFRDRAPRDDQRRAFEAQLELAGRLGLPVVIHTREAEDDTFAMLAEHAAGPHGADALLLGARPRRRVRRARLLLLVRRQRDLQERRRRSRPRRASVPDELILVETDSPYLAPVPHRGEKNEPANVVATAEFVADLRGVGYGELDATVEANAARLFGW